MIGPLLLAPHDAGRRLHAINPCSSHNTARLIPFLFLFALAIGRQCSAQAGVTVHNHGPAPMIDGSAHPEQVPDVVAYRLVLLGLSQPANPTEAQSKRHLAQFRAISMNDSDNGTLFSILSRFRDDYRSMIETYNAAATAANASGQRADLNSFLLQRDQFIRATHDQIKNALSSEGWGRLDVFVQGNKKHMKISVAEAGR